MQCQYISQSSDEFYLALVAPSGECLRGKGATDRIVSTTAIVQKWVPYSQRYLFNAIPDTNHNANPTNPNRYSKGNPNPTNPTNPNTRYRCE